MAQPGGRELFGAPWKGEGPLPLIGVAPQLQPLEGMLLRRSTDIYPKELARDMREFFNSLLGKIPHAFFPDMNVIIIKGLRIDAAVGVTNPERDNPQRLEVDAVITPLENFVAVADEIDRTVDYQTAAQRIAELARSRPRRLIETLASELAEMLVSEFQAGRAEVEVRKFVVPTTDYVAVRCARDRAEKDP